MALNLAALTGSPGLPGAAERAYPATAAACAQEWAGAMTAYASSIVPPSTTVTAAGTTLQSALTSAFALAPASRLAAAQTALLAWAVTVGGGMSPFVATPPATSPFATAFLTPVTTRAAGAAAVAASIQAWMITGSAVLAPAGAVPWS